MTERRVVEERQVPRDEHREPQGEGDRGAQQERERGPERASPCERGEQVARDEEQRERAAHRDEGQGDAEVGDEHVLEHVRRLEILLRDGVER